MTKELTKKETNDVALPTFNANDMAAFGLDQVTASDMGIPKLKIQQGLSKFVAEGDAKMGDICNTVTGEVLGDMKKEIEIRVCKFEKEVTISKKGQDGQFKFETVEPMTKELAAKASAYIIGDYKYEETFKFFVIVKGDLYIISWKSTSRQAGRDMLGHIMQQGRKGVHPLGTAFLLTSFKKQNDKGTFYIPSIKIGRKLSNAEIKEQWDLANDLNNNPEQFKEHNEEEPVKPVNTQPVSDATQAEAPVDMEATPLF